MVTLSYIVTEIIASIFIETMEKLDKFSDSAEES